jgi:acetyl-CoA C-acetyltransferase
MKDIFICDNFRTPFGSIGGFLSKINPALVGSFLVHHMFERNKDLNSEFINELWISNIFSSNLGLDFGTQVVKESKLSEKTSRAMFNAGHISGLKLLNNASFGLNGSPKVISLMGLENISSAPNYVPNDLVKGNQPNNAITDPLNGVLRDGYFVKEFNNFAGALAEQICTDNKLKRELLDEYVLFSLEKVKEAYAKGSFDNEICTLKFNLTEGNSFMFNQDQEFIRYEKTADITKLDPVFVKDGRLTLASSARSADGGSLVLMANEEGIKQNNLAPKAKLLAYKEVYGNPVDYIYSGTEATKLALKEAGVSAGNVDIWEVHEDFASTPIVFAKKMKIDLETINKNGGTLVTGNPIGSTGLRLVNSLTNQLTNKGKYGVAMMCGPSGGSAAAVFEKV